MFMSLYSKKRKARYTFFFRFDLNIDIINKEVIICKKIERLVEENYINISRNIFECLNANK